MAIVGTASVEIHAILTAVAAEIRAGIQEGMTGVGAEAGATFSREFATAAEGGLGAQLAGIRAEVQAAFSGAAGAVTTLTEANVRLQASQQALAQSTATAVAAEREYLAAIGEATAAMQRAVAAEDEVSGAARAEAAARTAASEAALASAQANTEASAQTVAALEADVAAARMQQAAMEQAAQANIIAATEESGARVKAAADARSASLTEVEAAQASAAAAKTASAEIAAATAAAADAQMAGAARTGEAATVSEGAAARTGSAFGKAQLVIVAAAGAVAYEGVKMATDFQAATERLVTSAGEQQSALDGVRKGILDMAGQVGYSAQALATAMYTIESGGQHGADGLIVLKAAAQGAKTENADLKTVSDAVTSALKDYGLSAGESATVVSKLVAATSQGKMTFQDLAGSMSAILPIASANHVSLNDVLGDLASMTVHGISAQQAAQNLADAMRHMAAPTQAQSKELAALGINAQDLSRDLGTEGLSGTISMISTTIANQMGPGAQKVILDLTKALQGLPPSVQDIGNKLLAGTITFKEYRTAMNGMDPITRSQASAFSALAGSVYQIGTHQVTGTAAMQSYTQALRAAMGDATGMNVALMTTGINAGTTTNAINVVSKATADAAGNVRGWTEIQGTFAVAWSKFTDGLGAAAIKIGTQLLPVLTGLFNGLSTAFGFIESHKVLAETFATIIGVVLAGAVAALSVALGTKLVGAIKAMGLAFTTNPVMAIITAIAMAAYLIITNWGPISRFFERLWNDVSGFFMGVWNPIWSFMKSVGAWFAGPFIGFFQSIWNFLKQWGPLILAVFMPIIGIPLLIIQHWQDIVKFFEELPGKIGGFFVALGNAILSGATAAWHWLVNAAETAGSAVLSWLAHLPQDIAYGLGFIVGTIARWAVDGFMGLVHAAENAWDATISFLTSLPGRIATFFVTLGTNIATYAVNAWHNFTTGVTTAWNDTWAWITSLPGRFVQGIENIGSAIGGAAVAAWKWFTNGITTAWNDTWAWITGLPGRFVQGLANIGTSIGTSAVNAWHGFTSGLETAWGATMAWFQALPGRILSGLASAGTWLLHIGEDILNGLIQGLENAWHAVWSWLTGIWNSFISGFKAAFGISSPSSVFAEIGQWIFEGLLNGLKAIWNTLVAWVSAAVTAFIDFFKGIWTDLQNFWNAFWSAISSIVTTVWNAIKTFLTNEMNGWAAIFSAIWNGIKDVFNAVWTFIQNIATTVWNAIKAFFVTEFNGFKVIFETIWNAIRDVFNAVWTFIQNIATTVWNAISSFFTNAFNAYKALFQATWSLIQNVFQTVWNFIQSVATTVWNAISNFFSSAFNGFVSFFQSVWNGISNFFSTIWNAIHAAAQAIWNAISSFFTGAFNGFVGFFQGVWNGISSFFSGVWNGIKSVATTLWNDISGFFTGAFNSFTTTFHNVWNSISSFFSGIWTGIKNTVTDVWNSITGGIKSGINAVINFVNGMIHGVNKVLGWVHLGPIGDIPTLATGGTITYEVIPAFAAGGLSEQFSKIGPGFKTTGPKAIVGEGNAAYPEYVIPTDPKYRSNATKLMSSAAKDMGMEVGGVVRQLADGGMLYDHPKNASGVPMLGLGDVLGSIWDHTGGALVHAVVEGVDSLESLLAKGVDVVVDGIFHGVESLIPQDIWIGQWVVGALESARKSFESWIGGAATTEQQKQQAAAAASGGNSSTPASRSANVAAVQAVAAGYGWGSGPEWDALVKVINRESGFNNVAQNPTSTAYGMFQFLNSTWAGYPYGKTSDPHAQAVDGLQYISGRYHDPIGAWNHEVSAGWYDSGGFLPPGMTLAMNNTGTNELIMPYNLLKDAIREGFEYNSRGQRKFDDDDAWARRITNALGMASRNAPISQFTGNYFNSADPRVTGGLLDRTVGAQGPLAPAPVIPQQPTTSTAVRPTVPTGDLGSAFSQALTQFAPELSQAISAGSATQIVTLGQALLSNPDRMRAINQSVADQLGVSVENVAGQLQDTISSALPTATKQQGADDMDFGAAGASATMTSAQSTVSSSKPPAGGDVAFHPGAFQVAIHGNADSVTVQQLQKVLNDWSDELVHQVRGRK